MRILLLCQDYAVKYKKEVDIVCLTRALSAFVRYETLDKLSEDFQKVANDTIENFFEIQTVISYHELYRLICGCIFFKRQINRDHIDKLVKLYIASEPQLDDVEPREIVQYMKQVSALLGRIHKAHVKMDPVIYEELRQIGEQAKIRRAKNEV